MIMNAVRITTILVLDNIINTQRVVIDIGTGKILHAKLIIIIMLKLFDVHVHVCKQISKLYTRTCINYNSCIIHVIHLTLARLSVCTMDEPND